MSFTDLDQNVIGPGLCTRCGICAGVCPVRVIHLDTDNFPRLQGECTQCGLCTGCCPGAEVDFPLLSEHLFQVRHDATCLEGYVAKRFVAHARSKGVREAGTSGGVVSALLIHLLESGEIDGAVVAGFDPQEPCRMKGMLATTAEEVLAAAGSKYCLTSSMEALQLLRRKKGRFAVVGLPCQVQGIRKLQMTDPSLARKIYCVFGLYCHCNMEPRVVHDVLAACRIKPSDVERFEFRGGGWPGGFHVRLRDGRNLPLHTTLYTTILNILFKIYGAKRCYLCVDALSEYADLSFGDFWAHDYSDDLAVHTRSTQVAQRTETGLTILRRAEEDGAINLYPLPRERASKRIANMVRGKKNRSWIRIARRKKKGLASPDYHFKPPAPSAKAKRSELILRLFFLCRGTMARKILTKFLFSRAATLYERINLLRKRVFGNFHGN